MERNPVGDQYLWKCKALYLDRVFPSDEDARSREALEELKALAKDFIAQEGLSRFSGFVQEYQYLVDLNTAHLIIELGVPDQNLRMKCLDLIKSYSCTPLNPVLAAQETRWLERFERT